MNNLPIKYCRSKRPYCNARIKNKGGSLCCRYGWCEYAESSLDRAYRLADIKAKGEKPALNSHSALLIDT